jgi:hypothetical protein
MRSTWSICTWMSNNWLLACNRTGLHNQIWCVLQIGYFKAKQAFFRFDWDDVQEDLAFVLSRYFPGEAFMSRGSPNTNTTRSAP